MDNYLVDLLIKGAILVGLDLPFLQFITTYFYNDLIPTLTGKQLSVPMIPRNILSIGAAYLAMGLALKELVKDNRSAFVVGIVIYATYSFTNMVIFQDWNPTLAIIETIWGGILYLMAFNVLKYFNMVQ
tara:strand:+ start:1707 stop:2093 length:387 start_codon:yes stop_codon:yes gene_type:complete